MYAYRSNGITHPVPLLPMTKQDVAHRTISHSLALHKWSIEIRIGEELKRASTEEATQYPDLRSIL